MKKRWVEDKSGDKKKSYKGEALHDASSKEKRRALLGALPGNIALIRKPDAGSLVK
jgi:hypothetical protein